MIRSFNDDKPYDQFVREQLAGDELDHVTDDSMIATGYYRLGTWDEVQHRVLSWIGLQPQQAPHAGSLRP